MGYLLLVCLIEEIIFIYFLNQKNVLSPSFVACAMFIFTTCMFLSAQDYFSYQLSFITVITILAFILCIFIGERVAISYHFTWSPKNNFIDSRSFCNEFKPIDIQLWIYLCLTTFVLMVSIIFYIDVYRFSLTVGNAHGNFATMAMYVRESSKYTKNLFISQGTLLSECILYFSVYCFLNNMYAGKKEKKIFLPIIAFIPAVLADSSRSYLIKIITIVCIINFAFMKKKSNWSKKINKKIIWFGLLAVICFFIIFRYLGYRTETSIRNPLVENIWEYSSASLVGLDKFLTKGESENILFGQGVFAGIYDKLREWGFHIPEVPRFERFYYYGRGNDSNIYTAFKTYIKDFSYFGGMIAMFLWGYFIMRFIQELKRRKCGFTKLCLIGLTFYPVTMISIEDVTASILRINTLYMIVYLLLLEYLFIKRKIRISI